MATKKHAKKLTDVQLQQQMLYYKAETMKYMSKVEKMGQQYDIKKMDELINQNNELITSKETIEKSYQELYEKYLRVEFVLKKIEEQKDNFEKTLLEFEKENAKLTDENNILKEKVEKLEEKYQKTSDTNEAIEEQQLQRDREEWSPREVEKNQEDFFRNFQADKQSHIDDDQP